MELKKVKYLVSGMVIGGLLSSAVMAQADYAKGVIARVASEVSFEFGGEKVGLPEGYTVLEYNGRVYVPARFVAEQLGAKVDWDDKTSTVKVTAQKPEETSVSPAPSTPSTPDSTVKYETLPVTRYYEGAYRLTVDSVFGDRNRTRIYVTLENDSDKKIRIDNTNVTAVIDGQQYSSRDVPAGFDDMKLFNEIGEDEEISGYLALPPIPASAQKMHLTFNILTNGSTVEKKQMDFDILLDVIDSGGR